MTFTSAAILLFLVLDPLGSIPLFMSVLRTIDERRRTRIIVRECLVAFVVLLVFMIYGRKLMELMQLSNTSLGLAGGIVLFLIALRIIFPGPDGVFGDLPKGEPFIVPLAIPLIAGPSALATVLLLVSRFPNRGMEWILALVAAISASTLILALGSRITRLLGERGVMAFERLMGLILTAVAVEMFLGGLRDFLRTL